MKSTIKKALSFLLAAAMVLSCFSGLSTKAQAAAIDEVTVTASGDSHQPSGYHGLPSLHHSGQPVCQGE